MLFKINLPLLFLLGLLLYLGSSTPVQSRRDGKLETRSIANDGFWAGLNSLESLVVRKLHLGGHEPPSAKPPAKQDPTQDPKEAPKQDPKEAPKQDPKEAPKQDPEETPKQNHNTDSKKHSKIIPAPVNAVDLCEAIPGFCSEGAAILERRTLEKRERRGYTAEFPGGKEVEVTALNYPSIGSLYSGPNRNDVLENKFDFKSTALKEVTFEKLPKVTKAERHGYVTEHIIELQSIKSFLEKAVDGSLKAGRIDSDFFVDFWNEELTTDQENMITTFSKDVTSRNTPNDRVFEAMGSTTNRHNFVVVRKDVNELKKRLWLLNNPISDARLSKAIKEAITGEGSADKILSEMRATLGVFEYLKQPEVKERAKNITRDVEKEMANIAVLYPTKAENIDKMWAEFIENHIKEMETKGRLWLKEKTATTVAAFDREIVRLGGKTDRNSKDRIKVLKRNMRQAKAYAEFNKESHDALGEEIANALKDLAL